MTYYAPLTEIEMDVIRHNAQDFNQHGDLIHAGAQLMFERIARLSAWLHAQADRLEPSSVADELRRQAP